MENGNRTEAIMSQVTTIEPTSRYGFTPQTMFAATRAHADKAREQRAAHPGAVHRSLIRRLIAHLAS
jgi:hypothetical protein